MDLREELYDFSTEEEQEWNDSSFDDDDLDVSDAGSDKTVLD